MSQVIKVECSKCEGIENYETEKFILIAWTAGAIGTITHETETVDYMIAAIELIVHVLREHPSPDDVIQLLEEVQTRLERGGKDGV